METKSPETNSPAPKGSRPKRSGRRKSRVEIASMARGYTETVIKMLVGLVTRDDVAPTVRINAGLALLDRGWGKPLQKVELEGDRPPQVLEIVTTIVDPKDPDNPVIERRSVEGYMPLIATEAAEHEADAGEADEGEPHA